MGLRIWVVKEQTHVHVPVGFPFEPINKPMDRKIDLNSYRNRAKPHQILGSGYPLPFLNRSCIALFRLAAEENRMMDQRERE
jgi:hypothetical protein